MLHYAVPIIIGLHFASIEILAYQKADRLFYMFQSVSLIFSQVIFTKLITNEDSLKKGRFIAIGMQFSISILFSVILYFFSAELMLLYYGEAQQVSINILKSLSIIIPLMGLNAALGLTLFVINNDDHIIVYTAITGAIVTLLILWLRPFDVGLYIGVYALLFGELSILIGTLGYIIMMKVRNAK
jgi:O-antigen/teichoic acid export membrane protein